MEQQQQQRLWCWYLLLSFVGIVVHAKQTCKDVVATDVDDSNETIARCAHHAIWAKTVGVADDEFRWYYTNFTKLEADSPFGDFQCMLFHKVFEVKNIPDDWTCPYPCTEPKVTLSKTAGRPGEKACPARCLDSEMMVDFTCVPRPKPPTPVPTPLPTPVPTPVPTTPVPTPVPTPPPTESPTPPPTPWSRTKPPTPPPSGPNMKEIDEVDNSTTGTDNSKVFADAFASPWLWFAIIALLCIIGGLLWYYFSSKGGAPKKTRGTKLIVEEDIEVTKTLIDEGKGKGGGLPASYVAAPVAVPPPVQYYTGGAGSVSYAPYATGGAGSVSYAPYATSASAMPQYYSPYATSPAVMPQ